MARGTNPDGTWAYAVPLTLEQRVAVEERGMKRSTSRTRGEASLALVAVLAFGGPVIVLALAILVTVLRRSRRWPTKDLGHHAGCGCVSCSRDERAA